MHVLFVHKNYPAQFGHIAQQLIQRYGFECTFISLLPDGIVNGIKRIQYVRQGGATRHTHYLSRSYENYIAHSYGVYRTLRARADVQPDLIVGHSGFGSTVFLADLYECPIINYFEYYYHRCGSDVDFRPDFPAREIDILRVRSRNAMILLDLQTCSAGYCPTNWQRSLFPQEYQSKLETIFDGIDIEFWRPLSAKGSNRTIAGIDIAEETKVVTYVARGFESMRGFDIFMKVAKRIYKYRSDVLFVCVGSDHNYYGGDEAWLKGRTFREWVLSQDEYELDRFIFVGQVAPPELVQIFNISDLHIYLTVPFVLSWSLMNALACECTVLASDTPPVREVIQHGKNGLLAPFYDCDAFVNHALSVLESPQTFKNYGAEGRKLIETAYSIEITLAKFMDLLGRSIASH